MEFDANKVKDWAVDWIREFFENNGKDCNCVVGISGGKDSSVVAALCVEALGKDRVIGVLMPNGIQNDIMYSVKLCQHLGIKSINVNIDKAVYGVLNNIEYASAQCCPSIGEIKVDISEQTKINLPARIRMATLYAVSQSVNGRVANTCNLSETMVSWETKWGDNVGDFAPIQDLTVDEVKQIGYCLNLPAELIEKTPSDGLCGKSDEDGLGFTYKALDTYIRTGNIDDDNVKDMIDTKVKNSKFKRKVISIPHYESGLKNYLYDIAY